MRGREELSLVGRKTDHLLPASKITSKMRKCGVAMAIFTYPRQFSPLLFSLSSFPAPPSASIYLLAHIRRLKPKVGEIQTISSTVDNDHSWQSQQASSLTIGALQISSHLKCPHRLSNILLVCTSTIVKSVLEKIYLHFGQNCQVFSLTLNTGRFIQVGRYPKGRIV